MANPELMIEVWVDCPRCGGSGMEGPGEHQKLLGGKCLGCAVPRGSGPVHPGKLPRLVSLNDAVSSPHRIFDSPRIVEVPPEDVR